MSVEINNFKTERIKKLKEIYSDELSTRRRQDKTSSYAARDYSNAIEVREALNNSIANKDSIVETSKKLYATNPIYASVIDYLANIYMWRYKIVPQRIYTKSKAKLKKEIQADDFQLIYNLMLEVVEGLSIETKFPALLTLLFTSGSVYLTTYCDEESLTIDSILLPDKYCRKVGETQYGTSIIQFDFSYFQSLGLNTIELNDYLQNFPKEFKKNYNRYLADSTQRWQTLDPHFSTGVLLNEAAIPNLLYLYGGILDYEKYQDNELERSENQLKYLVVHKMPVYQDKMIFEVDEVAAIHKSLRKIVDTGEKARLITTYGDVHVQKIAENDTSENQILSKAYKAIFNNAGFNSTIFTGESVEALHYSLVRDKSIVWKFVQEFVNFYNIAINNWFDFKSYQANLDILPISAYTYNDDIEIYKTNATLGVGKLDYFIASGIKQKNVADQLNLETFLNLDKITPMQTSYTQTAEDREETRIDVKTSKDSKGNVEIQKDSNNQINSKESEIEPSDNAE